MTPSPETYRTIPHPGESDMARRVREFDWSATRLGPMQQWPPSLHSSVSTCLECAFPFVLWWGPDLITIYNDEYQSVLGAKHPVALGARAASVWWEIWDVIGPMLEQVMEQGRTTRSRDLPLFVERYGYAEEAYFSFSYSPIYDEDGRVGGVFCPVIETTDRVVGERRLHTLRDLAAHAQTAPSEQAVCDLAASVLGDNPRDVPFAMIYLVTRDRSAARLAAVAGIEPGSSASPRIVSLGAATTDPWLLGTVAVSGRTATLTDLQDRFEGLPTGAWTEPPRIAITLPVSLPGHDRPRAILVVGASPRRALDDDYRAFFDLIATQIASGLADARALAEERRRAETLAAIDRAKTVFFSNVSHEFRTPLTLMLGPLEDSLTDTREPLAPSHQDRLLIAHRNSLSLLRLANRLLDFSRLEAGCAQASYEPVDLGRLTAELASSFRAACERAGLALIVECPPIADGHGGAYVDRDMWEKVVLNLVSNAFKQTMQGSITVSLRAIDGHAELAVADTGAGIPPDALPHLFERFYRVEGARGRTSEGSGIGLSLVQELVKLHAGTVRVRSAPGHGSTFTVSIPLGSAHLPQERIGAGGTQSCTTGAEAFVDEALRWLPGVAEGDAVDLRPAQREAALSCGSTAPLLAVAGAHRDRDRPRVLWADDNADVREYVLRLLAPFYEVCTVSDGEAALAEALARPPDLVLTDVMMPRMDGVELVRRLRSDPRTRDLPVILLSARAGEESRVEGVRTGADDYLIKPFSARELLARIDARLELARVRREHEQRITSILESISDPFQIIDAGWRITYMNPAARKAFASHGYDPDQMIGKHFWNELFPGARDGDAARHVVRAMHERVPVAFESYWEPWASWHLCRFDPLPDGGLANYFRDITERKRASDALRESREQLAADLAAMTRLQDVSTRLVQAEDANELLLEIVDAAMAVTGADMGNIQLFDAQSGELRLVASRGFERPLLAFFDVVRDAQASCGAAMLAGERVVIEDVATSPIFAGTAAKEAVEAAGVRAVQSTPLLARSGSLVGMLSTHYRMPTQPAERDFRLLDLLAREAADWIERISAEAALRSSEERFRRYFETGLIGMAVTTPEKRWVEVNDRLCEILGYERAELMEMSWVDLTHPDDLAADIAQFQRVLAGDIDSYTLDKRWIRKDGRIVYGSISVTSVRAPNGDVKCFVGLLQDVSARQRAEAALRESEERYRALISQVKDYAIFSTDDRGIVTTWNEGCQQVLGYSEEEFIGLDSNELFTPEDRAAGVLGQLRTWAEAGSGRHDRWMVAKGGRVFYAMGAKTGLRNSGGHLIGFSTVIRDVTQMKLSQDELARHGQSLERLVTERTDQLEKTTERLRLSERMASLGTLSAGLGHDMGNLLLPIDVRIQLLLRAGLPDELRDHVLGIQKSAQYLQRLSSSLRLLAIDPSSTRQGETTELRAWWDEVGMILRNVVPRGVEFEHSLPAGPCWLAIGRAALTQAVFNVVQNAADAMRQRSQGRVAITTVHDRAAREVIVRITDDGPGMPPNVLRRCMEPYFSTKARSLATGMGLSLVHGLVTDAGGRVDIDSTVGQGTCVTLTLRRSGRLHRGRSTQHTGSGGTGAGG